MLAKKNALWLYCLALLALTAYISCTKHDFIRPGPAAQQFFNVPEGAPELIKQIAQSIQKQNEKEQFLEEIIARDGYAVWDKGEIINYPNGETITYIPLVLKGNRYVNSYIYLRQQQGGKAYMQLIRGSNYALYGFEKGYSAHVIALDLMRLNQRVFQDSVFRITDGRLFQLNTLKGTNSPFVVKLASKQRLQPEHTMNTLNKDYGDLIKKKEAGLSVAASALPLQDGSEAPPALMKCNRLIVFDICGGGVTDNGSWDCPNVTIETVNGGPCDLPPLGPPGGSTGGGSMSGGGGGGGGSGSLFDLNILQPNCPDYFTEKECEARLNAMTPPVQPVVPIANQNTRYTDVRTNEENRILEELRLLDIADESNANKDCDGTNRYGKLGFNGVLEHVLIEYDYINNNLGGLAEYQIPNAGYAPNTRGYADIANVISREMFEIKPNKPDHISSGQTEVLNYITKANIACPPTSSTSPPWHMGANYTTRYLPWPKNPTLVLVARLYSPGLIVYDLMPKINNPIVYPVPIPQSIFDKLKDLVKKLGQNPPDPDLVIVRFLQENPDVKNVLVGVAVSIMVATIVEDFFTLGGGLADDAVCFAVAYRIIRIARLVP